MQLILHVDESSIHFFNLSLKNHFFISLRYQRLNPALQLQCAELRSGLENSEMKALRPVCTKNTGCDKDRCVKEGHFLMYLFQVI